MPGARSRGSSARTHHSLRTLPSVPTAANFKCELLSDTRANTISRKSGDVHKNFFTALRKPDETEASLVIPLDECSVGSHGLVSCPACASPPDCWNMQSVVPAGWRMPLSVWHEHSTQGRLRTPVRLSNGYLYVKRRSGGAAPGGTIQSSYIKQPLLPPSAVTSLFRAMPRCLTR